ncbi:MAG: WcbI family polysaccharide biosynthesis putative acetyltransferase [Syntrophobacteraceae bacterium]
MKRCLLIGNCQQYPLKILMQSAPVFNERYEMIEPGPIHTWTTEQVDSAEDRYNEADIILTQPIRDAKYGLAQTTRLLAFNERRKRIPVIVFPNVDFIGFFPFTIRVPVDLEKDNVPDAHCGIVFLCYVSGLDEDAAVEYCKRFYSDERYSGIYKTIYELALSRMESTERTFNIVTNTSYLFRSRYRDLKLMLNRLHPANVVCEFVANSVLSQLGIFETVTAPMREFWTHDEMPVSVSVAKALGIRYSDSSEYFYVKGILKRVDDYIRHLYWYYRGHPDVLSEAIIWNKQKITTIGRIATNKYSNVDLMPLFKW